MHFYFREIEKEKLIQDLKEAQQKLDDSISERNRLKVLEEIFHEDREIAEKRIR